MKHVVVYKEPDRFAAWPANRGFYKYPGDELVCCFQSKTCAYQERLDMNHERTRPGGVSEVMMARSLDGGRTWRPEDRRVLFNCDELAWRLDYERETFRQTCCCEDGFQSPDFLLMYNQNWIMASTDRGRTMKGPQILRGFGVGPQRGRPDYVLREDGALILFTTVGVEFSDSNARPACLISKSNGASWQFLSYLTSAPNPDCIMIMPSGILLPDGCILAAVRCQISASDGWAEIYRSKDHGRTWGRISRVNDHGNPCHLLLLDDGRLLATYSYRNKPFGIRVAVSEDKGLSWQEGVLRDDGGSWDLGYPRSCQLDDGGIATVYYWNAPDPSMPAQVYGGVRHIVCTRWAMGDVEFSY